MFANVRGDSTHPAARLDTLQRFKNARRIIRQFRLSLYLLTDVQNTSIWTASDKILNWFLLSNMLNYYVEIYYYFFASKTMLSLETTLTIKT